MRGGDTVGAVAPLTNAAIAQALDELGDLYELDGAEGYRVIAYRNAARSVRDAPVSVAAMVREGRATELNGIGRTLDTKLRDQPSSASQTGITRPSAERAAIAMLTPKKHRRTIDQP